MGMDHYQPHLIRPMGLRNKKALLQSQMTGRMWIMRVNQSNLVAIVHWKSDTHTGPKT